jgi:hypothetical protein
MAKLRFKVHAVIKMDERGLGIEDVRMALDNGQNIKAGPDEQPDPARWEPELNSHRSLTRFSSGGSGIASVRASGLRSLTSRNSLRFFTRRSHADERRAPHQTVRRRRSPRRSSASACGVMIRLAGAKTPSRWSSRPT